MNDTDMLRSIFFVKLVHTLIFLVLSVLLFLFLFETIVGRMTVLTWVAIPTFLIEGVVLWRSGWRCPITTYAEDLGADDGRVVDIFLPTWFADRVLPIYGSLFAIACVLLIARLVL